MDLLPFYQSLSLSSSLFSHPSQLHGIGHTYRVMVLAHTLSEAIQRPDIQRPAVAAAFIHDMAREHDGYCTNHGRWAAERVFPLHEKLFRSLGVDPKHFENIKAAVSNHSLPHDLEKSNPAYITSAILKDADALDRIRLSESNLDVSFLRFPESWELIPFARELYFMGRNVKFHNFAEVLEFAELINQK